MASRRSLALPAPTVNAYESKAPALPRTSGEGSRRFSDPAMWRAKIFGADFVEHYAATRHWEVREFRRAVTDWELERYFEII